MNMNKKKNERQGLEGPAKKLPNVKDLWNFSKINDKNKNGNSKIEVPKETVKIVKPKNLSKKVNYKNVKQRNNTNLNK